MTRAQIIDSTRCPRCGVQPGMACQEGGRRRPAVHPARRALAEMMSDWMEPGASPEQAAARERWRASRYGQRR